MIFSNPPLIELIAELRWGLPLSIPDGTQAAFLSASASSRDEDFFKRFNAKIGTAGFVATERIVPLGFPQLPFNVVYRLRKPPGATDENYLFQVGKGIFAVNALPPYRSWESFRPLVQQGVRAVLETRDQAEEKTEFLSIILRYIDLFSSEYTDEMSPALFMRERLGFNLHLPEVLLRQVDNKDSIKPKLSFSLPLKSGLTMNLSLEEGNAVGKAGVLMTTEVLTTQPSSPDFDGIMAIFEKAHDHVRTTFIGLTEKLHAIMQPEGSTKVQ